MLIYCLKSKKKNTECKFKSLKIKNVEQCYHQNVQYVVVKNQDF